MVTEEETKAAEQRSNFSIWYILYIWRRPYLPEELLNPLCLINIPVQTSSKKLETSRPHGWFQIVLIPLHKLKMEYQNISQDSNDNYFCMLPTSRFRKHWWSQTYGAWVRVGVRRYENLSKIKIMGIRVQYSAYTNILNIYVVYIF